jgi:uncharacterized protein
MDLTGLPLPELTTDSTAFWTGGERDELMITRCQACGFWVHPPVPGCRECGGAEVAPEAVSGTATVLTYTVNRQQWVPGMEVPFAIAIVELDEQPGLRLTTRVVGCDPETVRAGQRVRVTFAHHEDVWLPFFEPVAS